MNEIQNQNKKSNDQLQIPIHFEEQKEKDSTNEKLVRNSFVGLRNIASNCYLNSLIQALFRINHFLEPVLDHTCPQDLDEVLNYLKVGDDEKKRKKNCAKLVRTLQKLLISMKEGRRQILNPLETFRCIMDIQGEQVTMHRSGNDIGEFLLNFIENIHEGMSIKDQKDDTGNINNDEKIKNCFFGTLNEYTYFDGEKFQGGKPKEVTLGPIYLDLDQKKLSKSLDAYMEYEVEKKNDIGNIIKGRKVNRIKKAPKVLAFIIKRVLYKEQNGRQNNKGKKLRLLGVIKMEDTFNFPKEISIKKYLDADAKHEITKYRLYSMVLHQGSIERGHYYTISYDEKQEKWAKINDASVEEITEEHIFNIANGGLNNNNECVYCLFYAQHSILESEAVLILTDLIGPLLHSTFHFHDFTRTLVDLEIPQDPQILLGKNTEKCSLTSDFIMVSFLICLKFNKLQANMKFLASLKNFFNKKLFRKENCSDIKFIIQSFLKVRNFQEFKDLIKVQIVWAKFLKSLVKAISILSHEKAKSVRKTFFGKAKKTTTANMNDLFSSRKEDIKFWSFGLNFIQNNDLIESFEANLGSQKGYVMLCGSITEGEQEIWLTKLPEVLTFFLPQEEYSNHKDVHLYVPKEIFMDPYLKENKNLIKNCREQINAQKLREYTHFGKTGANICDIFQDIICYVNEFIIQEADPSMTHQYQECLKVLASFEETVSLKLASLKNNKHNKYFEEIKKLPQFLKTKYILHGLVIFEKCEGRGHHYQIIYDQIRGQWIELKNNTEKDVVREELLRFINLNISKFDTNANKISIQEDFDPKFSIRCIFYTKEEFNLCYKSPNISVLLHEARSTERSSDLCCKILEDYMKKVDNLTKAISSNTTDFDPYDQSLIPSIPKSFQEFHIETLQTDLRIIKTMAMKSILRKYQVNTCSPKFKQLIEELERSLVDEKILYSLESLDKLGESIKSPIQNFNHILSTLFTSLKTNFKTAFSIAECTKYCLV